jgi:hypothetical protein
MVQRALNHCLPFGNGTFLPARPQHLRDIALTGARATHFLKICGVEITKRMKKYAWEYKRVVKETFQAHKNVDIVSMLQMEADESIVESLEQGLVSEGDSCVLFNYNTHKQEPMEVSRGLVRAPLAARIQTIEGSDPDNDMIDALLEREALPPCLVNMERNTVKNPKKEFKLMQRKTYTDQMLSHSNLIDIEDIVQHVSRLEIKHPLRGEKAEKHSQSIRGLKSWYQKDLDKAVSYEISRYGTAQTASGSLSCKLIAWNMKEKKNLSISCPYVKSGAKNPAASCCAKLLANTSYAIKYPRDYTRLALHTEKQRRKINE